MATSRLIGIKSIDKKARFCNINARILRKWEQKDRYGKTSDEMILVDEEGSKIQATIPNSLPSNLKIKFEIGKVLNIEKFGVEENIQSTQKAKINHKWKLTMSLRTKVEDADTSVQISENSFMFTPFQSIGCLNEEFIVDVIGEVILPLGDFNIVQKLNARTLEVQLIDNNGMELSCVLWESYGDELKAFIENKGEDAEHPVIIILQFGMLSRFHGKTRVQTMKHASKLHINPSFPEVAEFRRKHIIGFSSNSRSLTTNTNESSHINGGDLWLNTREFKSISDLLTCNEVGVYTVLATIFDVDSHDKWFYDGCSNAKCAKGFDRNSKMCSKCKTSYGNVIPRFKIRVCVIDKDQCETHFVLFDGVASSLLGMSAALILKDVSEDQLPECFEKLFERECLFRIDVDQRTLETANERRTFTVKHVTEDTNIIAQFLSLINIDEVASKHNHGEENVTILNCNTEDKLLESMGESSELSLLDDQTPKKRLYVTISNDDEEQLSVTKGFKQIKQEKLDE